jgi:AcrR family transcriptional regulator
MASSRRIGAESSETRAALLDAAERLLIREGYAAVTSRRVAAEAELKPQLVHYYFRTMEDLFLAVFRRRADQATVRHEEALASPQPLRAMWAFSSEPAGNTFTVELAALANHRKAIRTELARYGEAFRARQLEALTQVMAARGIDPEEMPPVVLLMLMTSLSQGLSMEDGIGMSLGHDETRALVERWLTRLEGEARPEGADVVEG